MKNFLLVPFLLISLTGFAQFEENGWQVDGSFSYFSNNDFLSLTLGVGRAIKEDQVVGLRPGIVTDFDDTNYVIGAWYDKYKSLNEEWPFFLVWRWTLNYSDLNRSSLFAGIAPGFAFQPTKRWILTARFLSGNIGYSFDGDDVFIQVGTVGDVSFAYTF